MMPDLDVLGAPRAKRKASVPRSSATKVDATIDRIVNGDAFNRQMKELSPEEQELFWAHIAGLRTTGELDLEDLWKIDYARQPPSMKDFTEDDYWLGSLCKKTEEGEGLFPAWRDVLLNDFDLDSQVHNAVVTGSLGVGKSYVCVLLLLYRIAIARCMRNPQSFLGLAKGSAIMYVMLSVTRTSVAETIFGDAKNFMSNSPFFMEECKFNPGKKYAGLHVPLGGNVFLTAGSKGQHILGRNTMGVLLDEGNWRIEANPDLKAYQLYDEVRQRLKNRFQKISGYLPALSLLASSARDESAFTETVINEIRTNNSPMTERVYRFAVFRIKRDTLRLKKRWFKVEYGVKNMDPRILAGWYTEDGKPIEDGSAHEPPNDGAQVEFVPEDYVAEFKRNVKLSLQSICGVATGGSHRLFSSLELLEKSIVLGRAAGLVDPCRLGLLPISDEDDKQVWDFLDHRKFLARRSGRVVPLRDPDAPRFVHIDMATQSVVGLSICHAVGTKLVEGLYDPAAGATFNQYRTVVAYDFILAITAGQTKPISLKKIQDFIFWLRDMAGFIFGKITSDSFLHGTDLQIFAQRNIPTANLSLDKTKIPYYAWRTGFEESRIMMFEHTLLMREAEYLIDHPSGKVDHPDKTPYGLGSKDICDSAAGAYHGCVTEAGVMASGTSPSDPTLHGDEPETAGPAMLTMMPKMEQRPVQEYSG